MDTGLRKLETKFSLLLLPAIICSYPLDKTVVKNILLWFISGVTLASLICVVNAFYVGYTKTGGVSILSNQYFYDRDFFVSIIGIQPPYFGLYLSAALLFLLSFAISSSIRLKNGILLVITSAVLMTALLLTYSRMALLALVIIFLLWMLHYLISQKKILLLVLCLLAFIVSVQIIYNDPFLNRRLVEIFNTPIREPGPEDNNSVSIRYGQIYCSLQILREHPLTGVGLGDTQEKLHECYRSRNYHPTFIEEKLNPHNQYLDIGISSGIMGILVLLLVYASLLYIFYNKKAKAALFFVALIVLTSMTETVLNSFKGVVLFSFFCSVFIALRSNNYEAKARKN